MNKINGWKILIPAFIGLGVVGCLFYFEFKESNVDIASYFDANNGGVTLGFGTIGWLLAACLCMVGRDLGYMIRIRTLSDKKLDWRQAFRVIMLWEFTSAITPSAIGGTSVALMYVHKEGISVGKSSAIVMTTSLLDELYFVIMFPLVLFLVGFNTLFEIPLSPKIAEGLLWVVCLGYGVKLLWVLLLVYGLFVNPRGLSRLIYWIFHLPILRNWKRGAARAASDIIVSSSEMKVRRFSFWTKAMFSTFLSWTSRFMIVNCIFLAFFSVSNHLLIFARQLVIWITLLFAPTPGGSGVAETIFAQYLADFIPAANFAIVLALLWRLISYYPYLLVGAFLVPKWLKDKF